MAIRSGTSMDGLGRALLLAAGVLAPGLAAAQSPAFQDRSFDCVIEPQQVVKLATQAVGVLAVLDVDRGDMVRAGQVVGKLNDALENANLLLARAKASNEHEIASGQARLAFLKRKYGRASQLVGSNIVSQASTDEAESDMKVAENQLRLAQLNHSIAQLETQQAEVVVQQRSLVSPVTGVVMERLLVPGEYRNDQSPILTLAQLDPLRVEVFVPAAAYGQVALGMAAEVRPELPSGGSFMASVVVVDKVMDAASSTFGVRLRLPNPALALPGGVRCKLKFLAPS